MIPEMTDPRGTYWRQPVDIRLAPMDDEHVILTPQQLAGLAEYSRSVPISVERPRLVKLYSYEIFNYRYEIYRDGETAGSQIVRQLYAIDRAADEMILLEEARIGNAESESIVGTLFSNLSRSHALSS